MANKKNNRRSKNKSRKSPVCTQCIDTCSICLDVASDNSCKLQCGHEFHTKCIDTWFMQQWNDSHNSLEHELTLFQINNDNNINARAPFCAMINRSIMCYLGESAKFLCPVCKQEFTTKEDIDGDNPVISASSMMPILCKIDMGELLGVKCTHYITNFDELYYYLPKNALVFYEHPDDYNTRYMENMEPLSIHGKHLLVCKKKFNFFKKIEMDIRHGDITNLKMYTTLLDELILLPDSMLNGFTGFIEKKLGINDMRYYLHPEWF